jgi:hypothetical protein
MTPLPGLPEVRSGELVVWTLDEHGLQAVSSPLGDPLDAMMHPLRLDMLTERQADQALARGEGYAVRGGHWWTQDGPARHVPVPCTAELDATGIPIRW